MTINLRVAGSTPATITMPKGKISWCYEANQISPCGGYAGTTLSLWSSQSLRKDWQRQP